MTTVVNLYKEPYDVYIGRAGKGKDGYFGNPYNLNHVAQAFPDLKGDEIREKSIELFRDYFITRIQSDPIFKLRVETELKDKRLGCFCKPKKCHGDIYAEYLNSL